MKDCVRIKFLCNKTPDASYYLIATSGVLDSVNQNHSKPFSSIRRLNTFQSVTVRISSSMEHPSSIVYGKSTAPMYHIGNSPAFNQENNFITATSTNAITTTSTAEPTARNAFWYGLFPSSLAFSISSRLFPLANATISL